MSIFDRALHIPAETRFLQPPSRALERVLLPLQARPTWRLGAVGAVAFLIASACIALGVALLLSPAAGHGEWTFALAAGGFFLAVAVVPAGVVVTAIGDLRYRRSCLVVDGDGLGDARLGARLAWSDVERAELVTSGSGPCAVRLTLAREGEPVCNPCRAGGWSARWSARRRERTIALLLLDRRPHLIAQTILALAARNGVVVEQPAPLVVDPRARPLSSPWP
jgi:hypothetical protein